MKMPINPTSIGQTKIVPITALNVLLVEDNPTDRDLLRYLLEARLHPDSRFSEASNLQEAYLHLEQGDIDCVLLDLQLPDSESKKTFIKLNERFPELPIIVMTHNSDRGLALEIIQYGAADYIVKNYTDEEDIFRRILFAIEKHRRTVRVEPEHARSFHRLERAKLNLKGAQTRQEYPSTISDSTIKVTTAVADLSRKMFTELQSINVKLTKQATQQENIIQTVTTLDKELLRGHSNRPSMRSQVDLMNHRVVALEGGVKDLKENVDEAGDTQRKEALQLIQSKWSNRTKLLIAILTLVGVVATSMATYFATVNK